MTIQKKRGFAAFAGALSAAAILSACGEDLEQITSSNKIMAQSYEELVECNASNEGKLAYVKDSSAVYLCADSVWKEMYTTEFEEVDVKNGTDGKNGSSDGKNGTNGKDGQNGKNGTDGTSCTVSAIKDGSGYDVLCGGEKVGQLLSAENGEKGSKGAPGDKGGNGPKGDNGADGTNCTAKALADGSGFELSCDGKAVGTIKNGTNGEKGAAGTSCSAKSLEDGSGFEISCGGTVVGTLKNGESHTGVGCTFDDDGNGTITVKCGNKTEGVKVYKAVCGVTPYDPNNETCLGVEIENGNIKAILAPLCGGKPYNPEDSDIEGNEIANYLSSDSKQTCKDGIIYDLCGDDEYNAETQFCVKNKIYDFCEGQVYNVDLYYCEPHANVLFGHCGEKTYRVNDVTVKCEEGKLVYKCGQNGYYDPEINFCNNEEPYILCEGKQYEPKTQKCVDNKIEDRTFCGYAEFDNKTHFCGSDKQIYKLCGEKLEDYDPKTHVCKNGKIMEKCGKDSYDPETQKCEDGKVLTQCGKTYYDPATQECQGGKVLTTRCGFNYYDPATHLCDTRDNHLYKIVTITNPNKEYSETWMAENLNYAKKENYSYTVGGVINYDSTSHCYGDGAKGVTDRGAANCAKYGRLYQWYTAVGRSRDECKGKICDLGDGIIQGICPQGWHLPSMSEWEKLIEAVDETNSIAGLLLKSQNGWNNYKESGNIQSGNGTDAYGFSALPAGSASSLSYSQIGEMTEFWSSTQSNNSDYAKISYFNKNHNDVILTYTGLKGASISVRCIKNSTTTTTP